MKLASFLAAAAIAVAAPAALAQPAWPAARPITLIVPFSAGGSVDYNARLLAARLGERLHQTVVIENAAGAGGALGVGRAAAAAPDGYTIVAGPDSAIAIGKLINPTAYHFDPLKDLVPVAMLNTAPLVLVARPNLPANNWPEFVTLAKKKPGQYSYATSGIGTILQLAMELLKQRSGIYVTHVPYRGGSQIVSDLIGGQVDLGMLVSTSAIPQIQAGRLKALGVTGSTRLAVLPQVPTFAEAPGLKGYAMVSWTGLFAPAGTPPAIVNRLNEEIVKALADPEIANKMREQGAIPGTGTPQQVAQFVHSEAARYQAIVKSANIKE